jgi:hypothetical protein
VLDGGPSEVFLQGTRLSKFMESVEQVAGAMGQADADTAAEPLEAASPGESASAAAGRARAAGGIDGLEDSDAVALPDPLVPAAAGDHLPGTAPADPWATIFEAGAALLQGLAQARTTGAGATAAPITIERDPVTGQASVRLPLPDPDVMQRLATAFAPWLRQG